MKLNYNESAVKRNQTHSVMAPFFFKKMNKNGSCSTFVLMIVSISLILLSSFVEFSASQDIPLNPTTRIAGTWQLLRPSIGISAMHMQLLPNSKVVIFDRTDFGPSNISLPKGHCRHDPTDRALKVDCTAHSVLYDPASNSIRPLTVQTDTWCSSGALRPDGSLVQTGGYGDGERKVRIFTPCSNNGCDWTELYQGLAVRRWYATNQILPDGRVIILGGRNTFTYEFFPKKNAEETATYMNFLKETRDLREENNLYPFLHLLPDGNLFVFANRRSVLFDYNKNQILKEFPVIPGTDKRNYPSTGSSVLLPLKLVGPNQPVVAEVMICGGAPPGAFTMSNSRRIFLGASSTCGRLRVTDPKPTWATEQMPTRRVMGDMILLPTGDVLMVNGAANGTAGWEDGKNAIKNPILYQPNVADRGKRFVVLRPSRTPRMYHSSAILLPDGKILVGGSNPHVKYNFTARPYPTDLSLEAFSPPYLAPQYAILRPSILSIESADQAITYGQRFSINFVLAMYRPNVQAGISVALIAPSFTTHSLGMNQRLLFLEVLSFEHLSMLAYKVSVVAPYSNALAPPGFYMLSVVNSGVPSQSLWVRMH